MRLTRESLSLPRSVEPDVEIFAIGDIHGRSDLLEALLEAASREPRLAPRRRLVFLGDIVDRGPDNLGAIRLALRAAETIGADDVVNLMGNHETMMRMALDPATARFEAHEAFQSWLNNGGGRVVAEILHTDRPPADPDELRNAVRHALPLEVERWLETLVPHVRSGDVLFVHAGLNPRIPLRDMLATPWNMPLGAVAPDAHWAWVRRPFLEHQPGPDGWSGFFVVHGHSPNDSRYTTSAAAQVRRFRLNLDGGSAVTGVAKMGILRGAFAEVVTASAR